MCRRRSFRVISLLEKSRTHRKVVHDRFALYTHTQWTSLTTWFRKSCWSLTSTITPWNTRKVSFLMWYLQSQKLRLKYREDYGTQPAFLCKLKNFLLCTRCYEICVRLRPIPATLKLAWDPIDVAFRSRISTNFFFISISVHVTLFPFMRLHWWNYQIKLSF